MARIQPIHHLLPNGEGIVIRNAEGGDVFSVMSTFQRVIEERQYLLMSPEEFTPTPEQEIEWINRHNDAPHDLYIIVEQDGEVLGALGFNQKTLKRHQHWGEVGLFLTLEWRGMGLGRLLMQTFLDWATTDPVIEKVVLEVYTHNQNAIQLYRKMGFVDEGCRVRGVRFEDGQYADELLMSRSVIPG